MNNKQYEEKLDNIKQTLETLRPENVIDYELLEKKAEEERELLRKLYNSQLEDTKQT